MRGHDRRTRWKRAVYLGRPGMTDGCRVLLLRLLDDMNASGVVSIPRSRLAADLGVADARISERIKLARALGFLDVVRYPAPRVTAVYQATIPDPLGGTGSVPPKDGSEVRPPVSVRGTAPVPLRPPPEVRMYPTHCSNDSAPRSVQDVAQSPTRSSSEGERGETCDRCFGHGCPRCIPDESETA